MAKEIDKNLTANLQQSLNRVKSSPRDDKGNVIGTPIDPKEKRDNTIEAVKNLLIGLLDTEAVELIQGQLKSSGGEALGIKGIGKSGSGNNQYFPSFNVRTPIVEVSINGTQIYPKKWDIDTKKFVNSRMNFKGFNLTLPMGGTEKSVTGSISFFTKNPQEILDAIGPIGTDGNSMQTSAFATGGLPTLKLRFGWAFSDSAAPSKISKAFSPTLNMLVVNIAMTDPGTQGTTFTLTLQELGTLVLDHSTDNVIILSDYPQQQLRVLLEGLLHVRLFTLDDLFYFDKNQGTSTTPATTTTPTPAAPTPAAPTPTPAAPTKTFDSDAYLKGLREIALDNGFSRRSMQKIETTTITDLERFCDANVRARAAMHALYASLDPKDTQAQKSAAVTKDQIVATETPALSTAPTPAANTAQTAPTVTSSSETFFTTNPAAALTVNGKSFFNVVQELAAQCRCKWYPHSNAYTDKDTKETSEANIRLSNLASDLKLVQTMSAELTEADLKLLKINYKELFNNPDAPVTNNDAIRVALTAELRKTLARLSTKCTLFWVNGVPGGKDGWKTSSSDFYSVGISSEGGKSVPYEDGAFFLLPDILENYDIFLSDLPIQYGPGASAMPYFYGSGQNVFQTSVGNTGINKAKMFGEVISLDINHSSLLVALSKSAQEKKAYAVNGQWMGQLGMAQGFMSSQSKTSSKETAPRGGDMSEVDVAAMEAKGKAIIEKAAKIQDDIRNNSARFKGSLAIGSSGGVNVFDADNVTGNNKSSRYADSPTNDLTGPAQSTSYEIKTRVASFLRYPTQGKITILGDPNLIRLGPGCFELFSYYPVEHDKSGLVTQELNALTSGVYFVTSIEHRIEGDQFLTTMSGSKVVDPTNVPSSITNKVLQGIIKEPTLDAEDSWMLTGLNATAEKQFLNTFNSVNLNDLMFTQGTFAQELAKVFNTYSTEARRIYEADLPSANYE